MKSSRKIKSSSRQLAKATDGSKKKCNNGLSASKRHREKLNNVMNELSDLLPLPSDVKSNLDRLSVLKLTVSFFQTQNISKSNEEQKQLHFTNKNKENNKSLNVHGINLSELALEAIGGFFIVITQDGKVYYVSENVKKHTGYTQTWLIHQEFFPLIHPDDLQGLKSCFEKHQSQKRSLSRKDKEVDVQTSQSDLHQECYCNVRCHAGRLTSHVSPFYYKCFRFYGHIKRVIKSGKCESQNGLFALCVPISRSVSVTRPIKEHAKKYSCKMDLTMSNLQINTRGLKVLQLTEEDLLGKSAYFFFHPEDLSSMALVHERLMIDSKPILMTFRVVKGNGLWQWVRGEGRSIMKGDNIDGVVANNVFLSSEEEGVYYNAKCIKEMKEWKENREKALTNYRGSASSTFSPTDTCNLSPDTDSKSSESLYSSSTCLVPSTTDSTTLAHVPTVSKSLGGIDGYHLTLPEASLETYQTVPSKPACDVASSEHIPNAIYEKPSSLPHFTNDVVTKSEVSISCKANLEYSASIDSDLTISPIVKEPLSSAFREVEKCIQPCSSSALTHLKSHASRNHVQGTCVNPGSVTQDLVGHTAPSVNATTVRDVTAISYLEDSALGSHFEFDPRVDEMALLLQDNRPFVAQHTNTNPVEFHADVTRNKVDVEGNNGCPLLNLKEFDSSAYNLCEDSFRDFEMLPLSDIERILSLQEANQHPLTSDDHPSLEPVFVDLQSDSFPPSYEQKFKPSNLLECTEISQTESQALHKNQGSSIVDISTSSDLDYWTRVNDHDDDWTSRMNFPQKYNSTHFEEPMENCKFDLHKNHTTPCHTFELINDADSMVSGPFSLETENLCSNLSNESETTLMDKRPCME